MIYYNSNTINDWNFGDDNIIKVYRNNAVCYYKITSGDTPTAQTPCYAVVDNISQYSDTEFEDVFNKADSKWYKLNNINQYEEYGVYGDGRNITYYEGKLTIDEEITPSPSRLPQGYTEVEYIERNASHNGYIGLGEYFQANTRIQIDFQLTNTDGFAVVGDYFNNDNDDWRFFLGAHATSDKLVMYDFDRSRIKLALESNFLRYNWEVGNYYIKDLNTDNIIVSGTPHTNFSRPNQMYLFNLVGTTPQQNLDYGHIYSVKIWQNDVLVKEFVPCQRDSDNAVGLYDIVNDEFHNSSGGTMVAGSAVTPPATTAICEFIYSGGSWNNVGAVTNKSYRYWMWRSVGQIVGSPTNYIQFSEFDLSVNGSDVSLSYISAAPTGVTNETADKLFDNSTSTKYCANFSSYLTTNYVLFDSTTAITPTSFSMTTANDSRDTGRYPKDWVLLGSNTSTTNWNDGSWDTVLSGTCGEEMRVNYKRFNYPISGIIEYPVSYTEMQDPPNNLSFSSMTEAEEYECPWVGMQATIDGDKYIFSGDSISGYEWVEKSSRVPSGYTEVEYVENTSSAYLNLGVYPYSSANNSYYIEAKFASTKGTGEFEYLFSCEQGNKSPYVGLICRWSRYDTGLQLDGTNYTSKNITNNQDGTSGFTITSNLTNATNTTPITLFCGLQGSTVWRNGKGKVYSFKVTINDNLVRDMIPCKRDNDNMVGMYDIVNDVFYYPPNYSSYQLVAGPSV